jgi:hypothetical protein
MGSSCRPAWGRADCGTATGTVPAVTGTGWRRWAIRSRNRCQASTASSGGSPYTSDTSHPGGGSSGMAGWNQFSRIDPPAVSPVSTSGYHGTRPHPGWPRRWRCSARALRAAEAMNSSQPAGHSRRAHGGSPAASAMAYSTA